jgi:RNA ligase (TIGR02306 family)
MSEFQVRIRRIKSVSPHPNADRLEICQVEGYQCVVRKGQYHEGELVAYIPEQSVLPDELLIGEGLWKDGKGLLSGKDGNVVKPVRLRGEISQGLLYRMSTDEWKLGEDVTDVLGITKYEAPIPPELLGEVEHSPILFKYDVEDIKTWPDVLHPGEQVHITEKLHGTFCLTIIRPNSEPIVSSKGLIKKGLCYSNEYNLYSRTVKPLLSTFRLFLSTATKFNPEVEAVAILGEVYGKGVQDLHYSTAEPKFRLFDMATLVDGLWTYSPRGGLYRLANIRCIDTAPVLYEGPWSPSLIETYTSGQSTISDHIREGVVICSSDNREDPSLGRVILKSVSPEYLFRKGGTEYN